MAVMMLYVAGCFLAACGGSLYSLILMLFPSKRPFARRAILVGSVVIVASLALGSVLSEQDAIARGFSSAADQRTAALANIHDATIWKDVQKRIFAIHTVAERAEKEAAVAETLLKTEEDRISREATAREAEQRRAADVQKQAEQERKAGETLVKTAQDRAASEEAARRAVQARNAAEARRRSDRDQQAAAARAKVEQERAAAEMAVREAERTHQEAEARARAEQEHLAAKMRVKAEEERVAAEVAARKAEQERLAAEALDREEDARIARAKDRQAQSAIRSMTLLTSSLKDPSSAQLGSIKVNHLPDGKVAVCGFVNAKNSFGAYAGMHRFVAAADLDVVVVESVSDNNGSFSSAWANWCE